MKNSKLRRILMLLACAVLLVSLSVGATLAYLTSTTGVVENTFTVGKVVLDDPSTPNLNEGLDEAKTNEYGEPLDANEAVIEKDPDNPTYWEDEDVRVQENNYKLIPGHTYVKDPVVYVQAKSEPCLVYVIVDDPLKDIIDYQNISQQMNAEWHIIGTNGNKTLYGYKTVVDARNATEAIPLDTFKYIKILGTLEYDDLTPYEGEQITVRAFAIQADGMFAGAEPEWVDFKNIWNANFADPHMTLVENTTTE